MPWSVWVCFHLRIVLRPDLFLSESFEETREEEILLPRGEGGRSEMEVEKVAEKIA